MTVITDGAPYLATALGVSGVAGVASRKRELIAKWFTWMLAAPIVAGALAFGAPGAVVLAASLGVVAAGEYARLVRLPRADLVVLSAAAVAVPLLAWLLPTVLARPGALLAVPLVAAAPALLRGDARDGARRTSFLVLGLAGWAGPRGLGVPGGQRWA